MDKVDFANKFQNNVAIFKVSIPYRSLYLDSLSNSCTLIQKLSKENLSRKLSAYSIKIKFAFKRKFHFDFEG